MRGKSKNKNDRGLSVIPCQKNPELQILIRAYAEVLKTEAHKLGSHDLGERDFYDSGLFRGVIERIRGQFSATMREKREFVRDVLNYMQDRKFIRDWESSGSKNRFDYMITMPNGKVAGVELKGCLDGNNSTIYERPDRAQEFLIWSVCTNRSSDPRKGVWSAIHTRLSAEIIQKKQVVDGMVVWDWICGTLGRPCPKLGGTEERLTSVSHFKLTPPCIYVLPPTIPNARNNPRSLAQALGDVLLLKALHECFGGRADEINYVDYEIEHDEADTVRRSRVRRAGEQRESGWTAIRRS